MNERDIWAAVERLEILFRILPKRLRTRRIGSYLGLLTMKFMDYMTRSNSVSDEEALEIGRAILGVYRTTTSIESLYGRPIDENIVNDSVFQQITQLFDSSEQAYDAADFTLFTAACISHRTGLAVSFVPVRKGSPTPDLQVASLCYIECKDLAVTTASNVELGLRDRLQKAGEQLASAQSKTRLPSAGAAIDVPIRLADPDDRRSLEVQRQASEVVRQTLTAPGAVDFVLLSVSGIYHTATTVGFPHRHAVFIRPSLPPAILGFLGKLTSDGRVYICA